ncbi:hypothetical protein [Enterobacter hormaechei]|uniref:hypothetical protein n=1 Tax=Enterobacter hormaechei TaxID=158836 RepID=UPI0007B388C2|nr:hypothetical protein [Enterobacter hormaechei]KZP84484.1 hypothetical protein A3N47_09790 [Enterobacter hormaechei subsp. xiangfangensis]RTM57422.1 hypothetical protein EKO17_23545 [Enterobacter hormaechei subsp. xiangfangensis]
MIGKTNKFACRDYVKLQKRKVVIGKKSSFLGVASRLVLLAPVVFIAVFLMVLVYEHSLGF